MAVDVLPAIPHPSDIIRSHKEQDGAVAAILPIHYPRALFRAFGILPVEVWGPPGSGHGHEVEHLQSYICSIVRNALGFLLSGGLADIDFLVVPHTCDSLQGFGSLLLDFITPDQAVVPFYLPRGNRGCDVEYLASEFNVIYRTLEAVTSISPAEEDLLSSIHREETADGILEEHCIRQEYHR